MKFKTPQCESCKSKKMNPFHFCNLEELGLIGANKSCNIYQRGQIIFQQGSNTIGLFCINSGRVKIYKYGIDGKEQIVRIAGPGDFVGYRSLLAGSQYSAFGSALDDCTICLIYKQTFFTLMKENNCVADAMIKMLCGKLREAEEKMVDLAYMPLRGRVAEALLLLQKAYEDQESKTNTIVIPFSRKDLASMVGTAQESVIRLLSEFKNEKLVELGGRKITILDSKGLVKISNLYD